MLKRIPLSMPSHHKVFPQLVARRQRSQPRSKLVPRLLKGLRRFPVTHHLDLKLPDSAGIPWVEFFLNYLRLQVIEHRNTITPTKVTHWYSDKGHTVDIAMDGRGECRALTRGDEMDTLWCGGAAN